MLPGNASTLDELVAKTQELKAAAHDWLADSRAVHFDTVGLGKNARLAATVHVPGADPSQQYILTDHAFNQLCAKLDPSVPPSFGRKLIESGHGVLAQGMVNYLAMAKPETRMVRCLDAYPGQPTPILRSWMSNAYKRLDNPDLIEQALVPVMRDRPDLRIESAHVTYDRMFVKVVSREMRAAVKVGDDVCAGVRIENSETGLSALTATPFVMRLVCLNGMIAPDRALRQIHLGARDKGEGAVAHLYSDETLSREAEVTFLKFRDVIGNALSEDGFSEIVRKMRGAADEPYTGDPIAVADTLAEVFGLIEAERVLIQGNLYAEPRTKWGMVNAVTAAANTGSYERSDDLQAVGGKVLDLDGKEWRTVSTAQSKYTSMTNLTLRAN